MTCDELERRLTETMDRATAEAARAHVLACARCAALVADRALTRTDLPLPPAGFAHLTAVTARMGAPPQMAAHRSRRGLRAALAIVAVDLMVLAMCVLGYGPTLGTLTVSGGMAATSGLMALAAAAMVMGGWTILSQAPPTRRRA